MSDLLLDAIDSIERDLEIRRNSFIVSSEEESKICMLEDIIQDLKHIGEIEC